MSKIKTPQEKKRLAYAKDCRNAYGEHNKASRKNIKGSKRLGLQAQRSKAVILKHLKNFVYDEGLAEEAESKYRSSLKYKRLHSFKKCPDQPLEDHIKRQSTKRQIRFGRNKNSYQRKLIDLFEYAR